MQPLPNKPKPTASPISDYGWYDDEGNVVVDDGDLEVFFAGQVWDYLAELSQRCEQCESTEEIKAILKDGLDF